jgi:hypothetical protein
MGALGSVQQASVAHSYIMGSSATLNCSTVPLSVLQVPMGDHKPPKVRESQLSGPSVRPCTRVGEPRCTEYAKG